jgi:hypothetical protein
VALVVLIVCLMLGLEWTLGRLRSHGLIA